MGLAAVLGYSLIAGGPGLVVWCFFIAGKSFLVLLALASSVVWLLSLLFIALVFRGFLPWLDHPGAYAPVLAVSVALQEGLRLGVFHINRRMLAALDDLAHKTHGAALCFEDRHALSLAHGMGHAIAHSAFFYLCWVPTAMGDGTLYLDQCPQMSYFLYAAICSLAFSTLHASSMVVALDALTIGKRRDWLLICALHLLAALLVRVAGLFRKPFISLALILTLMNFVRGGCMVTAPLLLALCLAPVVWCSIILWRGPVHTHEPLRQDEH